MPYEDNSWAVRQQCKWDSWNAAMLFTISAAHENEHAETQRFPYSEAIQLLSAAPEMYNGNQMAGASWNR